MCVFIFYFFPFKYLYLILFNRKNGISHKCRVPNRGMVMDDGYTDVKLII